MHISFNRYPNANGLLALGSNVRINGYGMALHIARDAISVPYPRDLTGKVWVPMGIKTCPYPC